MAEDTGRREFLRWAAVAGGAGLLASCTRSGGTTGSGTASATAGASHYLTIRKASGPWPANGNGTLALGVAPSGVGNLLVLAFGSGGDGKVHALSSGVSGGGVATWHRAAGYMNTGDHQLVEIWYGIVTAARAATLTISNSSAAAEWNRLWAQEFTASGINLFWTVLAASKGSRATGSSIMYPSLTGSGLYFGVAESGYGTLRAGTTPGFSHATIDSHLQTAVNVTAVNGIPTATSSDPGDRTSLVSALFTVSGTPIPLGVTTASLPIGYTGQAYSASLAARGGTPPYAWSVASGSLPTGLALSGAGTITGSPATSGRPSFTAKVTDNAGNSATASLGMTVSLSPPVVYSSTSYGAHYPDPHPPNPQITMPGVTDSGHGDYTDNNCWGQTRVPAAECLLKYELVYRG